MNPDLLLLVLAAVCFLLASVRAVSTPINLQALGLFFWVLTLIL